MRALIQPPVTADPDRPAPLWIVLHGAFATAEQATALFAAEAAAHNALLLAPQATRACGEGYCWSFASDAPAIRQLIDRVQATYPVDPARIALIGYSMGCTIGCWLLAQNPTMFSFFAALGMGSAFEPWEHDDGGIDRAGLQASAATTRVLLAVDQSDPAGTNAVFDHNLIQLSGAGLHVDIFRPNAGTHAVTAEMKAAVLQALLRA